MRFTPTAVDGAVVVDLERRTDERGFFARAFCSREFAEQGIRMTVAQTNVSATARAGTVRGLHLQTAPAPEAKLVRCTRGAVFDVVADVRPGSPTYGTWVGVDLTEDNGTALYVPEGCAHGFQALADGAAILYDATVPYHPDAATGVRYDDPVLEVAWPLDVTVVSDQDRTWPLLDAVPAPR